MLRQAGEQQFQLTGAGCSGQMFSAPVHSGHKANKTKGGGKMKYRKLGNTGLIVSELALGSMQFGGKMNMGNLGQEDTTRMVKLALDRGINFIDTADVYSLGESETLLGNALKGVREEIVLATKVRLPMSENLNRSGATRVNIMREVEGSLRRLQTDYIDLYQVHGWDSITPLEETLRTLDDLVRQGKVRYIGLSNLMSWQAATAVMLQERLGLEKYVTAQMYYSLVGRGLEYEFQSFAEYHNIGILVWSPLAGGFLAGKYSRANPAPAGSRFAEAGQFVPFDKEIRPTPNFVKAYMHNGYFKSLKEVVHFYNTRDVLPRCRAGDPGEKVTCWPPPEDPTNLNKRQLGNLKLTDQEEDDLVAFLKTLTDDYKASKP